MVNYIKKLLRFYSTHGLDLPTAFDVRVGRGSVSLLFAHIANFIATIGIGMAIEKDLKFGVLCAIGYSALMVSFYMLRSLSKVKLDVKEGEFQLDTNEEQISEEKEEKSE